MYLITSCLIDQILCWLLESSLLDFVIHGIWKMFLPVKATPTITPLHSYRCTYWW
ncbi:uncharacterized protein LACBIDRAFT_306472 [Laccaria bicolor S238N-H82]|uniref:Predicted protein n=1 Tax=Laccaria bicolor (strain S238N-H82 / ATCC MYA-4686) TaxID=486041 RepID=B0DMZ0_LACBS|nr:uncharacterized protein LACBIDRAFT_306472 [Laccaria bicolor S238N-H82]EDR04133.1 predicted protein [Laccaria bicolor S238N-H82]|eukprot:XP_001885388.1 predicted protein [Laccaria bicolor S238N-H82]